MRYEQRCVLSVKYHVLFTVCTLIGTHSVLSRHIHILSLFYRFSYISYVLLLLYSQVS